MARGRAVVDVADALAQVHGNERRIVSVVAGALGAALAGDPPTGPLAAITTIWLTSTNGDVRAEVTEHRPATVARLGQVVSEVCRGGDHAQRLDPGTLAAAALTEQDVGAVVVAPVSVGGRRLGVLAVTRAVGAPPFTDDDADLVAALAALTAMALSHSRVLADTTTAMEELRQQGELLDYVFDAIVACDADGLIVSWNAGAARVYGYQSGEAVGCDLFALLATEFIAQDGSRVELPKVLTEVGGHGRWEGEVRERRIDGMPLVALSSITAVNGDPEGRHGLVVVNRDVTEQRRKEHLALHDELTGLPNRRQLLERLAEALSRSTRTDRPLAALFLDLDGFKPVNDRYGHAVGDEVLQATAHRLSRVLRQHDTVARLGGDEFVAVLEDVPSEDAVRRIVSRVQSALAEPVGDVAATVTASIGVVLLGGSADGGRFRAEDVLDMADEAMYHAKRHRTGSHVVDRRAAAAAAIPG